MREVIVALMNRDEIVKLTLLSFVSPALFGAELLREEKKIKRKRDTRAQRGSIACLSPHISSLL